VLLAIDVRCMLKSGGVTELESCTCCDRPWAVTVVLPASAAAAAAEAPAPAAPLAVPLATGDAGELVWSDACGNGHGSCPHFRHRLRKLRCCTGRICSSTRWLSALSVLDLRYAGSCQSRCVLTVSSSACCCARCALRSAASTSAWYVCTRAASELCCCWVGSVPCLLPACKHRKVVIASTRCQLVVDSAYDLIYVLKHDPTLVLTAIPMFLAPPYLGWRLGLVVSRRLAAAGGTAAASATSGGRAGGSSGAAADCGAGQPDAVADCLRRLGFGVDRCKLECLQ
jgi:hypothetical protein